MDQYNSLFAKETLSSVELESMDNESRLYLSERYMHS